MVGLCEMLYDPLNTKVAMSLGSGLHKYDNGSLCWKEVLWCSYGEFIKSKPLMNHHKFRGQPAVQNAYDNFDKDIIYETWRQQCWRWAWKCFSVAINNGNK